MQQLYILAGCSMTFQYMYTMCNNQIRVIATLIMSDIYHFFVLGIFKILLAIFEAFN
jgi:hypothetical protein